MLMMLMIIYYYFNLPFFYYIFIFWWKNPKLFFLKFTPKTTSLIFLEIYNKNNNNLNIPNWEYLNQTGGLTPWGVNPPPWAGL